MKTKEKIMYDSPQVEIIEVSVEQGFAASGPNGIDDMPVHDVNKIF